MKILAFDTSTAACSVALLYNDTVVERFKIAPKEHNQLVLKFADQLLKEAGLTPQQLDALAFGKGPGSFTGVRIAASVVQGIALGCDLRVVPVSTLHALAQSFYKEFNEKYILATLPARMDEVYYGFYECIENQMVLRGKEGVGNLSHIEFPKDKKWVTLGIDTVCYPHASYIAQIAKKELIKGNSVSAQEALPIYLQDTVVSPKE